MIDATLVFRHRPDVDFGQELVDLHAWLLGRRPSDEVPVTAALLVRVVSELARLQLERQPFKVLIDEALARGLSTGKCDAGVLELATRLGFLGGDLGELAKRGAPVRMNGRRWLIQEWAEDIEHGNIDGFYDSRSVRIALKEIR